MSSYTEMQEKKKKLKMYLKWARKKNNLKLYKVYDKITSEIGYRDFTDVNLD